MPDQEPESASPIASYLGMHDERAAVSQLAAVESLALAKSLAIRTLVALPLAFGLVCASVWASRISGSAKIQATPGIILGVVFGYAFGFGLAARARRVSLLVCLVVGLLIAGIVAGAIFGVHALWPSLVATAGTKRLWFAAGAFGGTTVMCALIALRYESKATLLLR